MYEVFGVLGWKHPEFVFQIRDSQLLSFQGSLNGKEQTLLQIVCLLHICSGLKVYVDYGPGWWGSVDGAPVCKPKAHRFDSHSGHMPGLRPGAQ